METILTVRGSAALVNMPPASMARARVVGAYLEEARSECLRYMLNPAFMLPIMLFPAMFYLLFGVLMAKSNGAEAARYLLASYGVFGVMSPGLFGFGVSLALERDGGLLTFKRALPMPPGAYLLGKMLMAMAAAGVVIVLLLTMAASLGHVSLSLGQAGALLLTGMLGVLPFCALGMFVGTLIKGQGAPGVLQLIYLPMSFVSGLWFPLPMLPKFLQQIAPVWPSYHLDMLALAAVGMQQGPLLVHVLVLVGFAAGFLWLAARRLRRYG
jgi:ABC-2 type transport system permease protein